MQQNLLPAQEQPIIFKMDIQFVNSLHKFQITLMGTTLIQFLLSMYLFIILLTMIPLDEPLINRMTTYLTVCLNLSVACIVIWINRLLASYNLVSNIQAAYRFNHATHHDRQQGVDYTVFNNLVSDVFDATNPMNDGMGNNEAMQLFLQDQISHYYFWSSKYIGITHFLIKYTLVIISVLNQIYIWRNNPQLQDIGAPIYIYTGIQLLILFQQLIITAVILISPLLCVFALVTQLYEMYKNYRNTIRIKLPSIPYSKQNEQLKDLIQCAICYMAFQQGQKISKLKCPGGHTFHTICIESWIKVQKICPICRFDLVLNN